ncbi:hypothetical protein DW063_01560 [Ruminococcus sp. AF43-11]|nr:hypothetical protein DW063_01560 [Ruminococcus sp. AF43-11]
MPTPLAFIIYKKIIAPKWLIIKCFSNLFVFFTKKFKKTFEITVQMCYYITWTLYITMFL